MPRISAVASIGWDEGAAGAAAGGTSTQQLAARRGGVAHEETALLACFEHALGQQLVIGGHHGIGADAVMACALAHRGQARAGQDQALLDALCIARGQLLGQRNAGAA
jgi:hypothetical protein